MALILFIHAAMLIGGYPFVNVDWFFQLINEYDLRNSFFSSVWYRHGSPPGYSILFRLFDILGFGDRYNSLPPVLAMLHAASFLWLRYAFKNAGIRFSLFISAVLLLNPPAFFYFNYPSYSTFIFASSALALWALFNSGSADKRFLIIVSCLAFSCFIRSTWHIVFIVFISVLLAWKFRPTRRSIAWAALILLLPASAYIKNYFLFGKFESSTWLGFSLCRMHINSGVTDPMAYVEPFTDLEQYYPFINTNDPLITKYANVSQLNRKDYNNIRCIGLSDSSLHFFLHHFSIRHSLSMLALNGIPTFFSSPGLYGHLYGHIFYGHNPDDYPTLSFDIFELPDVYFKGRSGAEFHIKLSWYTILYPFTLLLYLFYFRRTPFSIRIILLITLFISLVPVLTDPMESNRMRWEVEPFYYFLLFNLVFGRFSPLRKQADRPVKADQSAYTY
ncbi:MAG: hypothetical protein V4543_10420 [Bacteroidota bacterium]